MVLVDSPSQHNRVAGDRARVSFCRAGEPAFAVVCDGCLTFSRRKGGYCADCPLRAGATQKKVETCGHCPDHGCGTLEAFVGKVPMMRERLAKIHEDHLRSSR